MKTYAFAGASGRAQWMYAANMVTDYADVSKIVGVYDANIGRARDLVRVLGKDVPVFETFEEMMAKTKPDVVLVTTTDVFHSDYIIRSLELGSDVVTEKPMTTTDDRVRAILEAEKRTGHKVTVTFNYRYAPFMTKIKDLIQSGVVGDIYSVHFEWLLSRNMDIASGHGASYFRRWNARMKMSSGLLVHKSTHHFDLINWWLNDRPAKVSAYGKLRQYGAAHSPFADVPRDGLTCRNCNHKDECEFYYGISEYEQHHYAEQEIYDGALADKCISLKDNCLYAKDIDIYDTMAVNVEYEHGALLSYSLNATTPYEGWHMVVNGSKGRLETVNHEFGEHYQSIKFFDLKNNETQFEIPNESEGHGGGDRRLRDDVFLGAKNDPLGHAATSIDGAYSVLVGVAANKSIKEEKIIRISDLLK